MELDWENPRHVSVVLLVVLSTTIVASFGFYSLTGNPALPEMTASVSVEEGLAVEQSGEVEVFTIEHAGGESVPLSQFRIVIGTRANGLVFDTGSNWSDSTPNLEYVIRHNDGAIAGNPSFAPGDRMTLTKVEGTLQTPETVNTTVRLFHEPSQQAIETWELTF